MYLGSNGLDNQCFLGIETWFLKISADELDLNTFYVSFIVADTKIHHHKIQGKPIFKRQAISFLDLVHTKVKTSKGA